MAVEYFNGQLYDVYKSGGLGTSFLNAQLLDPKYKNYNYVQGLGYAVPVSAGQSQNLSTNTNAMFGNPFGSAMSGNQSGTLQPYVNRMTQNASNALYGGLLNYQPQSMIAGNAGGTPQNSTVPQGFNIPSALQGMMGSQGLNFGNRSWMKQGGQ